MHYDSGKSSSSWSVVQEQRCWKALRLYKRGLGRGCKKLYVFPQRCDDLVEHQEAINNCAISHWGGVPRSGRRDLRGDLVEAAAIERIPIYCHNLNSIQLAKNPVFHARMHIEVHYHFVCKCVLSSKSTCASFVLISKRLTSSPRQLVWTSCGIFLDMLGLQNLDVRSLRGRIDVIDTMKQWSVGGWTHDLWVLLGNLTNWATFHLCIIVLYKFQLIIL